MTNNLFLGYADGKSVEMPINGTILCVLQLIFNQLQDTYYDPELLDELRDSIAYILEAYEHRSSDRLEELVDIAFSTEFRESYPDFSAKQLITLLTFLAEHTVPGGRYCAEDFKRDLNLFSLQRTGKGLFINEDMLEDLTEAQCGKDKVLKETYFYGIEPCDCDKIDAVEKIEFIVPE